MARPQHPPGAGILAGSPGSSGRLGNLATAAAEAVEAAWVSHAGPRAAADPAEIRDAIERLDPCPEDGKDVADVFSELSRFVLGFGVRVGDPRCAAHLHAPPLLAAAAAELAIGATNQSMDSFEQAPAATFVEDRLVRWMAALLGFPAGTTGVFSHGGTASNLHGLLLARDAAERATGAGRPREEPLPGRSAGWRILASEDAHFSIRRACALLGLGTRAVISVPVDSARRMDPRALEAALDAARNRGEWTIAVVATAGTTDAGAIDPLERIAELARGHSAWLHVDAAVGAGLALSPRLAPRLAGIELADSVTADLHKLFWQPIGVSTLLVADPAALSAAREPSPYLDRDEEHPPGMLNLVARSLDTSRRFDAFKLLVSLRATGRTRMAAMVEHVVDLAERAGEFVAAHPQLELLAQPQTTMVLFRWCARERPGDTRHVDRVNVALQQQLLASGDALIGRTSLEGRVALKLTLVNPAATSLDLEEVLSRVVAVGRRVAATFD